MSRPLFPTSLSPALQIPDLDHKQDEGTKVQVKTLKVGLQKVYAYIYSALLKFFPEHFQTTGFLRRGVTCRLRALSHNTKEK